MKSPNKEKIVAIVVSHSPGKDFIANMRSLVGQTGKVVIVNNGSSVLNEDFLSKNNLNCHLINNAGNSGQGKALNQGAQWAIENKYDWILLMDQDSAPDNAMVNNLIKAYQVCPFKEKIGIVGTNCVFFGLDAVKYNKREDKVFFERDVVMASGSLVSLEMFKKIGPFREEFFIDSTDADYCLRARKFKYKVIVSYNALMTQRVGESKRMINLFGKKILVTNHSAKRCYYMTRNGLILIKEYFFQEPSWVIRRIGWYFLVKPLLVILFEDNKGEKIKEIFIGYWHGIISKVGK